MLLDMIEIYSAEQMNFVPPGFSNNIIWNIGHIIVVQQMLVYKLSGLPMMICAEMVAKYKRGTRPEGDVSADEVALIKSLLIETVDKTLSDYKHRSFKIYHPFTTMTGYEITDAESAADFNNYHEGVHIGIILGIRKFI
jgi:hypothetical protein